MPINNFGLFDPQVDYFYLIYIIGRLVVVTACCCYGCRCCCCCCNSIRFTKFFVRYETDTNKMLKCWGYYKYYSLYHSSLSFSPLPIPLSLSYTHSYSSSKFLLPTAIAPNKLHRWKTKYIQRVDKSLAETAFWSIQFNSIQRERKISGRIKMKKKKK